MDVVAKASTKIYLLDLVSFGHGLGNSGLIFPDTEPLPVGTFTILRLDGSIITKTAHEIDVVDRSCIHPGQVVAPAASDLGSQLGVVTGVTTLLDLVRVNRHGEPTKIIRGVSPCDLQRVRSLNLGDFVVSGPWLGRVVEVYVDVDVLFEDGAVCKVSDAETKMLNVAAETDAHYRPKMNSPFYPGQCVYGDPRAVFKASSRWLRGYWNPEREVGVVTKVHVSGALVSWIASAHYGTDQQLIESSSNPPAAIQNPDNLTFLCAAFDCSWGVADRCCFREPSSTETDDDVHGDADNAARATCAQEKHHGPSSDMEQDMSDDDDDDNGELPPAGAHTLPRKKPERLYGKQQRRKVFFRGSRRRSQCRRREVGRLPAVELEVPMIVAKTRTSVDVLWQDGTLQHSTPSASVVPFEIVNDQEFFPGQCVIDNAFSVDDDNCVSTATATHHDGIIPADGTETTRRRAGIVRNVCYKDQTARVSWWRPQEPREAAGGAFSYTVVSTYDLKRDPDHSAYAYYGDVVVRRPSPESANGAGGTPVLQPPAQGNKMTMNPAAADLSWVGRVVDLPADGQVRVRWGDGSTSTVLPSEISVVHEKSYAELRDEMGEWVEDQDASSIDDDTSEEQVAAYTVDNDPRDQPDSTAEAITVAVTRNDAADDDAAAGDDSVREAEDNCLDATTSSADDGLFSFPHFGVTQSPSDHYYLDTINLQGGGGGKSWVKALQKEWQILDNNLPETIYVRAFEDRMDLLRVVMLGASGTPYSDGLFFFDMHLPPSYPAVPPQVHYHSFGLSLNPNLYASGTVCLSLLSTFDGQGTEVWLQTTSSLLQVVVSIQSLVLNEEPYYNEAGYETLVGTPEGRRNALPYSENAYLLSLQTMLHLLRRPPRGFEGFIGDHFRHRGRFVLTACQEYLQGCVVGTLARYARVNCGSRDRPCSAGLRLALTNLVPGLVAAFRKVGAEGCGEFQELINISRCVLSAPPSL